MGPCLVRRMLETIAVTEAGTTLDELAYAIGGYGR